MDKIYRRAYKGKPYAHAFTKSGVKNSITHDKKYTHYDRANRTVHVYGLVLLEEIDETKFERLPKERFWYFAILDTEIDRIIVAETLYEASEGFQQVIEKDYPDLSFKLEDVVYRELDVTRAEKKD